MSAPRRPTRVTVFARPRASGPRNSTRGGSRRFRSSAAGCCTSPRRKRSRSKGSRSGTTTRGCSSASSKPPPRAAAGCWSARPNSASCWTAGPSGKSRSCSGSSGSRGSRLSSRSTTRRSIPSSWPGTCWSRNMPQWNGKNSGKKGRRAIPPSTTGCAGVRSLPDPATRPRRGGYSTRSSIGTRAGSRSCWPGTRPSKRSKTPIGPTARRWIAAWGSSGTGGTSWPRRGSCCGRSTCCRKCGMRNVELGTGNSEFGLGNGQEEMADGKCQMADGKCQMAEREPQVAEGEPQVTDEQCEGEAGGRDEGQRSEPMAEETSSPLGGHDSDSVLEDSTNDNSAIVFPEGADTDAAEQPGQGDGDVKSPQKAPNKAIYERPVVKRGGADFVSQGSCTSPSPSASVDLAHLRPVRGRFSVHPATHPLSPRPRESFLPQCRQCTKR